MAITWAFYADAGLTVPLTSGGATVTDGGGPTDRVIFFGSPASGKTLQAASAPGVDQIVLSVADADADAGAGAAAGNLVLALTAGGLDTATPGDPLPIGTTLNSGVGGAVAIFTRTLQGALAVGSYADLSITTSSVVEA